MVSFCPFPQGRQSWERKACLMCSWVSSDGWVRKSHSEMGPGDLPSLGFPISHLKPFLNLPPPAPLPRTLFWRLCCLKQTTLIKHFPPIFKFLVLLLINLIPVMWHNLGIIPAERKRMIWIGFYSFSVSICAACCLWDELKKLLSLQQRGSTRGLGILMLKNLRSHKTETKSEAQVKGPTGYPAC